MGKSGSGKDTQAHFLESYIKKNKLNFISISTGELGRKLAEKNTFMGRWVRGILRRGDFFPNWLQVGLWFEVLKDKLDKDGVIFFPSSPRLMPEAKQLDDVMVSMGRPRPVPIYFEISDAEATKRLLARGRGDDHPKAIRERMRNFKKHVLPIIRWYGKRIIKINGEGSVNEVSQRVLKELNGLFKK